MEWKGVGQSTLNVSIESRSAPCVQFPVGLELGRRNKDYHGLLATLDIDFASGADLERAEVPLHLTDIGGFQVKVCLSEPRLELCWRSIGRVGRAEDLMLYRHCKFEILSNESTSKQPNHSYKRRPRQTDDIDTI
jgi:hypothetical protein